MEIIRKDNKDLIQLNNYKNLLNVTILQEITQILPEKMNPVFLFHVRRDQTDSC